MTKVVANKAADVLQPPLILALGIIAILTLNEYKGD
jgi:hypothetical protein